MCGFIGQVNFNINKKVDLKRLRKMTDIQSHRGPDSQGLVSFSIENGFFNSITEKSKNENLFHCGLGFNRLSILDTSDLGNQPMVSKEKDICIVFNI